MSAQSRFNLPAIRYLGKSHAASERTQPDALRISRRDFLGLSAAAGAAVAIPPFLYGDGFAVAYDGSKIVVSVHGEPRWTIDAAKFGPSAQVGIQKADGQLKFSLVNGTFPGTEIPANFEAVLTNRAGAWTLEMVMGCGIRVEAQLLPWLNSQVPAQGRCSAGALTPCNGFNLNFHTSPKVEFSRDWVFAINGSTTARVDGLPHDLDTNLLRITLNPDSQIANGVLTHKSLFQLQRGSRPWRIDLERTSEQGWGLAHDKHEELFDELAVETATADRRTVHSALLQQGESNASSVRLITGGGLVSDSGDQFYVPLHDPRIAFSLNESPIRSAFVAEISRHPNWAHGEYASYYVAGISAHPNFELIDDGDQSAAPNLPLGLCQVCFPADAVAMNLKFDVPKPFRVTWADVAAPFERLWGKLHLLPSRHAFDIYFDDNPTPDHILQIERPEDLVSLRFQFKNLRLITGCNPRVALRDENTPGQISVIFPPQHVAEEAFFHTDDNLGDPNQKIAVDVPVGDVEVRRTLSLPDGTVLSDAQRLAAKAKLDPDYGTKAPNIDSTHPRTVLSGESRLVFSIPKGETEIPFHLENLLDWKDWTPVVADVARTDVNPLTPPDIPATAPLTVTSIELPYKLMLSPSERGRWAHVLVPAKRETGAIELWHTRLAVFSNQPIRKANKNASLLDETNTSDRTVRAIWSPDYASVTPGCDGSTTDPQFPFHYSPPASGATVPPDDFRMSLDRLDRCELVHLTSNYRIQKPSSFCKPTPSLDDLLLPAPVSVENLMLTSIGGYLKSYGAWNPAKINKSRQLTVEQWRHIATLGRDQFVRVVYKGYLLPFGHRASLVKVTERKIVVNRDYPKNGYVAILHQRMFIVVQRPVKDFPVLGQPHGGREVPFRRVEVLTLVTPDIDLPDDNWPTDGNRKQTQSLFWPRVSGKAFPFQFRFTDLAGATSEASLPVVFADAKVSQTTKKAPNPASIDFGVGDAIDLYKAGNPNPNGTAPPPADNPWTSAFFAKLQQNQAIHSMTPMSSRSAFQVSATKIRPSNCIETICLISTRPYPTPVLAQLPSSVSRETLTLLAWSSFLVTLRTDSIHKRTVEKLFCRCTTKTHSRSLSGQRAMLTRRAV